MSLLGVEEKYHQSNKKLQLGTAGHSRCNIVACPCCTGQESDSSMGKLDSCHDLQHQQRETELAVAVESVLREVGEDPEREVGNLTSYLSFEEELQCIWMASCFRLCQSLIHRSMWVVQADLLLEKKHVGPDWSRRQQDKESNGLHQPHNTSCSNTQGLRASLLAFLSTGPHRSSFAVCAASFGLDFWS